METASVSAILATQLASKTFIMSPVATEQFRNTRDCKLYIMCTSTRYNIPDEKSLQKYLNRQQKYAVLKIQCTQLKALTIKLTHTAGIVYNVAIKINWKERQSMIKDICRCRIMMITKPALKMGLT